MATRAETHAVYAAGLITGPLVDVGVGLPALFGFAAIAAVIMGGLSFALARKSPAAAVPSPRQEERQA